MMKINFRRYFIFAAVAIAFITAFAFKTKPEYIVCSAVNPMNPFHCLTILITDDDCTTYNTGEQCTTYVSASHPTDPAFQSIGGVGCAVPLYHYW